MARKKKPEPSFNVPEAVRETGPTGWVYRTEDEERPGTADIDYETHAHLPATAAPTPAPAVAAPQPVAVLRMPAPAGPAPAQPPVPAPAAAAPPQRLPGIVMVAVRLVTFPLRLGVAAVYGFFSSAASFIANETKA